MDQLTTYRANGKTTDLVFLFKYDLNGNLRAFEFPTGTLDQKQQIWLRRNFPLTEDQMQFWIKSPEINPHFQIDKSAAVLTFDALWELYGHKVSKLDAEKAFDKMAKNEADVIKCFLGVPKYLRWLQTTTVAKLNLATFINKKRYNDEL